MALVLKDGSSFVSSTSNESYQQGYLRISSIQYGFDSKTANIYISIYTSKEESDAKIKPPIDSQLVLVTSEEFNLWLDLPVLELSGNIIRQAYLCLMQKRGMYIGTLLFGDDWESDE